MRLQKKEKLLYLLLFASIFWLFERMPWTLFSPKLSLVYLHGLHWPCVRPQLTTHGQVLRSEDRREGPSLLLCCGAHVTMVTMECLSEEFWVSPHSAFLNTFSHDLYNNMLYVNMFYGLYNFSLTMLSDALPLNHASDYKEQKVWNQNCLGENLDMVTREVGKVAANRYILLCHDLEKIGSRISVLLP